VINRLTGLFCLSLLLAFAACLGAQQQDSDPPTPGPQQTTPPQQANPSGQTTPPTTPQTPSQGPQVQAAPELPKYPDVRLPGEYGFWIGINGWEPRTQPFYDKGHGSTFTEATALTLQGHPRAAEGVEAGVALGLHNALRFDYFRTRASGNVTPNVDTVVPGQLYPAGTLVTTDYVLSSFKLSFEYLTWPYPVESRRFRLMTLWQFQYMAMKTGFDAPQLPVVDTSGNPIIGADGNPISYAASSTKNIITPMFGIGLHEYATKHFRIELNGSGFAVPHHWTIWEADATANIRIDHFEIGFGAKAFHFKTSPQADFFSRNTMAAPFVSVKWFSQ
jgi:hypothetical protein